MYPNNVHTITLQHDLLAALNCAHYVQSDARGRVPMPNLAATLSMESITGLNLSWH